MRIPSIPSQQHWDFLHRDGPFKERGCWAWEISVIYQTWCSTLWLLHSGRWRKLDQAHFLSVLTLFQELCARMTRNSPNLGQQKLWKWREPSLANLHPCTCNPKSLFLQSVLVKGPTVETQHIELMCDLLQTGVYNSYRVNVLNFKSLHAKQCFTFKICNDLLNVRALEIFVSAQI